MSETRGLPAAGRKNVQRQEAREQQADMNGPLFRRRKQAVQQVRVQVSQKQDNLEEQQADHPDRSSPSEPGQDEFGDKRLNLEKKKGACENR